MNLTQRWGLWLGLTGLLQLSACSLFSTPPRQAELEHIGHWQGRFSLKVLQEPPELISANFEVNGRPEQGELALYSPIGTTLAVARWNSDSAELLQGQKAQSFPSVEAMTLQLTGNSLPLPALLAWLDHDGAALPGWSLQSQNSPNHRRVFAKRESPLPQLELTLVIDPKP